jgi:hypothetical protein
MTEKFPRRNVEISHLEVDNYYCMKWSRAVRVLGDVLLISIFSLPLPAQQLSRRLILKDGSYQLATKWEVHGERVRYFSAERSEWEEVPNSMVDWPATEKYQKDRAAGVPLPEALKLDKELAAERAAEDAKRPEVASGLRLPEDGGVLLLDTFESQPQLVPLEQKLVHVNQKTGERDLPHCINNVCADPDVKDKLDLAGPHADVQAHIQAPVLFVKLETVKLGPVADAAALKELSDRFRVVRAQAKKDRRILGAIKVSLNGMAQPEEQKSIPFTIEPLAEGWLKITPAVPLTAGEYGLVTLMNGKGEMNLNMQALYLPDNVWDFGVNPAAPANPLALKPEVPAVSPPGEPPAVQKRSESPNPNRS